MKKSLLIALAACAVVSANAQMRVAATKSQVKVDATTKVLGIDNPVKMKAQKAEPGTLRAKAPKKIGANEAKYYRPRGTFYVNWDTETSGYIMPFLQAKPYQELNFVNCSTAPMAGSSWAFQYKTDPGTQDYTDDTFEGQDFTYTWGLYDYPDCPLLSIPRVDSTYSCTQGASLNRETGKIERGPVNGSILSVVNSMDAFGEEANLLASPHYYGSSNRAYTATGGFIAYTGALAPDGTDNGEGYWFGRNGAGWNGFATAVEAPAQPYVLNRVYAYVNWLKGQPFDVTCRVYRLDQEYPYVDDDAVEIDPAMFDDEHLIASGVYTVSETDLENGYAVMPFDLEAYNAELDMNIQVTPEIDFPIIIVMSGYDVPECEEMSFFITQDREDEGYGEQTYMLHLEDGVITACYGINNFFVSGEMKVGNSIFMDVSMPFMIYNYTNETGEYTFPNEGGSYALNDHPAISIFSDQAADAYYYELEDGGEVPEWLTIEIADGTGEFEGTVDVKATAAALPEGTTYREAKVKFYYAGANLVYTFKQGVEGTGPDPVFGDVDGNGSVGVEDVNAVINVMLGKAENPLADLSGNGSVGVEDVNMVINIMLGKNN